MAKREQKKISKEKEDILIEKTKSLSIKEGSAYSFMDGFGLRYITPYALALGANNLQIGYLTAIPSLLGNLSQLFTFRAMERYSRKKIIFWAVLLQAFMWIVLLSAGVFYFVFNQKNNVPGDLVVIIYTLLILFGAFAGPAWASLMRDIIKDHRGNYFGGRNKIAGTIAVMCMLTAGFILDYFKQTHIFIGFIVIFGIAFAGRLVSALLFLKHYEPKFKSEEKYYFSLLDFIKKMKDNNFGRFVIYFAFMTLAVAIASPFFAVYMLKEMGFSYVQFMIVMIVASLSSLMFMPFWGRFSDSYGSLKTMKITGIFVPIIPLLWAVSALMPKNMIVIYLICIEILSGIVWAGFNLAAGNFIYDAVSRERMPLCISYFNIITGFGVLIGASLGGFVSSLNFLFYGITPILAIMIISGAMRLLMLVFMGNRIKEVREVKKFDMNEARNTMAQLSLSHIFGHFNMSLPKTRTIG